MWYIMFYWSLLVIKSFEFLIHAHLVPCLEYQLKSNSRIKYKPNIFAIPLNFLAQYKGLFIYSLSIFTIYRNSCEQSTGLKFDHQLKPHIIIIYSDIDICGISISISYRVHVTIPVFLLCGVLVLTPPSLVPRFNFSIHSKGLDGLIIM